MEDDEINIDFSKIKKFFKKKTEEDKIEKVEKEAEVVKAKIEKSHNDKINKVEEIEKRLETEETEAMIIDGEKKLLDKQIKREEKQLKEIDEDDDEVNIDFSKIKGIFKKKAPSETHKKVDTPAYSETDDEEISVDFSKVKKLFKPSEKTQEVDSDEVSFDFSKVKSFFKGLSSKGSKDEYSMELGESLSFLKKHSKTLTLLLLILIPFFLSIYIRAIPAYLPVTDDWATNTIHNSIRQQITGEIRGQYPNLPQQNINTLVDERFLQVLNENKATIESQSKELSQQFKSRLQRDGQTYLLAIDPFFWMRHAKNVLENGHPGDELRDINTREPCFKRTAECVPWDNHMFAPVGRPVPGDMFHAYFEAYLHKFLTAFNPDRDLMSTTFIVPIIVASLAIIPAFFIARKLGGDFGGFIAALMVAIHPAFLTRTAGGFADTDAYNVIFPLLIAWLFLEALNTKNWKFGIGLSVISAFFVATYTKVWAPGWWYIFDFLIASIIGFIVIYALIHRDKISNIFKQRIIKHTLTVFFSFFISALIFTTIIADFATFRLAFTGPIGFSRLKEVGIDTVWPNVFTTVAEQNSASLNSVVGQIGMGNMVLFLLAILGITLTLIKRNSKDFKDLYYFIGSSIWLIIILAAKPQSLIVFLFLISVPIIIKILLAIYNKNTQIDFELAIILIIWFTATVYASTKGVRFLLILVPAFSIGFGIASGIIYTYVSRFIAKNLYLNKNIAKALIIILLVLLLIKPYNVASATAKQEIPSMNDAWFESLDKINRESEQDAIINSWWDFGHWFKYIGDRAVTFDGTSQNTPMAHWIGHTLLTNDEVKATGILRMLDCGSNTAFTKLNEDIEDTAMSVSILHKVVKESKKEAKKILLDYVDSDKSDEVLEYTHCEPPENYYITSDDMIGKSGVWGHFGIWNFDRALIYNKLKKQGLENDKQSSIEFMKERLDYSDALAEQIYFEVKAIRNSDEANRWIAPWPSVASGVTGCRGDRVEFVCPVSAQGIQGTLEMTVNLDEGTAEILAPNTKVYPNSLVYPTEDGLEKIQFNNNTLGYAVTLIPNGNTWSYVMLIPPLEDSMFVRLFYLDGHGLKHFKKFSDLTSVTNNRIITWKVDWEGSEMNILDTFKEPEIVEEQENKIVTDESIEEDLTEVNNSIDDVEDLETENNSNQ